MSSWMQNPILVKFARTQMRKGTMLPAVIGIGLLSLAMAALNDSKSAGSAIPFVLMGLQEFIILCGAAWTASAVAHARESGMLDLHRITPMSKPQIAVGFWLGPTLLTWMMVAIITIVLLAQPGLNINVFGYLLVLVTSGLLWQAGALVMGLNPGIKAGHVAPLVFIIAWMFGIIKIFSPMVVCLTSSPVSSLIFIEGAKFQPHDKMVEITAVWVILLIVLLHQAIVGTIFWSIACRSLRNPLISPLSKRGSLCVFAIIIGLVVLDQALPKGFQGLWGYADRGMVAWYVPVAASQLLLGVYLGCSAAVSTGTWLKGLQRLKRVPELAHRYWSDTSLNIATAIGLAVIVLITAVVAVLSGRLIMQGEPIIISPSDGMMLIKLAFGVAAGILSTSFLRQATKLQRKKGGDALFMLLMLVIWILPLFATFITDFASSRWRIAIMISPIGHILCIVDRANKGHYQDMLFVVPMVVMLLSLVYLWFNCNRAKTLSDA